MTVPSYEGLAVYYGDLHCHCDIGYGFGTAEDAYRNARMQLDFASVTAHAHWPDMPVSDPDLAGVVRYHQEGFRRAAERWLQLLDATEAAAEEDRFVAIASYEWHSLRHGDYNVYHREMARRRSAGPRRERPQPRASRASLSRSSWKSGGDRGIPSWTGRSSWRSWKVSCSPSSPASGGGTSSRRRPVPRSR